MMDSIDEKSMIGLACSLISKETVNPPGDEYLVKALVVKSMKDLGMKIKIIGDKKRPNILGEVGKGHPSIAILCHMDVVPPGRDWKTNPFKAVIKSGRLYGRGACDDKGPYAASWAAIKAVLSSGKKLKGKIILGAVADEETGSTEGIKLLLKKKKLDCDFCFIPDGGRVDEAVIGEKGMLWLKFASVGKSAHGSNPDKGINAINNMANFLSKIAKLKFSKKIDSHFSGPTINIGEIKGGDAPNIVPSYCEATIDIRYPLGIKKEDIIKKVKSMISFYNRKNRKIILKEILQDTSPHLLDIKKYPFLKKFLEASKEAKEKMKFVTIGGNSVAKLLYFAGIPSFSHSPEDIPTAHQADESVSLKNLRRCAILWAKFLEKTVL
ncbi:MAG: ArgE/DapE family deacylase [Candidatus Ratteibacteria bacterium]|nr:ArgE/DapE family deacylase [Candidatus Ratteibacteria bacterium]